MKKEILLPISIIVLGGCLILSAWIVTNGLKNNEHFVQAQNTTTTAKALMTSAEAAQYMGITLNDFNLLIKSQVGERAELHSYDTYRFIPFIDIGNQKYFNRAEIDKWIEYSMLN
ncbi:helix-turn-helix domain-containing protein [Paenibacillus sp. J22TS3]|uniref:helix-turn-helix domain-containing protein n=1 Tax=Paenibacillus sp. J22TS3 TaxID=2807192 RepID=UPI001B084CC9|nr:helix-turn-helix domain-containing protein [Paenibacillus sp. J22TS3]GIP24036.1 hypothetical protein J22TS3_43110 [Paenibacillus sp. J22TS3]